MPNIKTLAFLTGHNKENKRLCATCKDANEFKEVLAAYPATNDKQVIGTASDKYFCTLNSPFLVRIDNPAAPNQYNNFSVKISYQSNDIDMQIEMPINCISDFVRVSDRNITDSEHHYFIGCSYKELHSMKVRQYVFKADQISWYGGDKTLKDETSIKEIIDNLLK